MFNRSLSDEFITDFIKLVNDYLSLSISKAEVDSAISLFNEIEKSIEGRIAGDVQDYLFNFFLRKYAASKFVGEDYFNVEIGVLFGGSFIFTLKAIENTPVKFIAIDPFNGYYISDTNKGAKLDILTKLEITVDRFKRNLSAAKVSQDKVSICQNYSTDADALAFLQGKKVSVLFIDGDHSYKGVKFDFEEYSKFVVDEGYIVIDNYNDIYWPEVKKYCDELAPSTSFGNPLVFGRSLILQKGKSFTSIEAFQFKSNLNFINKHIEIIESNRKEIDKLSKKEQLSQEKLAKLEKELSLLREDLSTRTNEKINLAQRLDSINQSPIKYACSAMTKKIVNKMRKT